MVKASVDFSLKQLRQALNVLGIENLVWDFDGTLVDTRTVFINAVLEASAILSQNNSLSAEEIFKLFDETTWSLRSEMGVNPAILLVSLDILVRRIAIDRTDPRFKLARKRITEIYSKDVPSLFPGALSVVDLFNRLDRNTFLMTHAEEEWTWFKITRAGFVGKFKKVVCFSVDHSKSEQWSQKFSSLGLDPTKTLVIGDNLLADVLPALDLGTKALWINRGHPLFGTEKQKTSDQGAGVWQVNQLEEIPRFLIDQVSR